MARKFINLGRLPRWLQTALALGVVALVAALAWRAGGDVPPPPWVVEWLNPALGWLAIVLVAVALLVRWGRGSRVARSRF